MGKILYGIGVGPGDPELLTVKALRRIGESNVIILPGKTREECYAYQIVKQAYPEIEKKEILCLPFPMIKDHALLKKAHDEIFYKINGLLQADKTVAFLTIGDPCVYSTYSYVHRRVLESGGRAVIISGVPSFCAAAAALGISLGDNREEIHIIPASYDISHTLELKGTKVYMKSGKKLDELKALLMESKEADRLEIYSVSNCGLENETVSTGLENLDTQSGYLTIVIVKEKMKKECPENYDLLVKMMK
ncbi:precorrin-2 C(20)-methyltransferase [Caproiciproducens faecalis]|uniref:Precorrin-2 C(20)-methyltransferase n=1 Tax=Caproiciproducens faecalis TaxID=2820301 RepID=A0ABS7DJ27_9FIRM|nr:precorrin-2 C(20)-methyltransferase [Caproiciproducens faecalis]MBW7571297.1 precorrin-2 C(20)-methyltransferase [Caproiciproducens faecalis]